MKSLTRKLGPDIKVVSGPLAVILIVALLTFVTFQNGYARLRTKMAQHAEARQLEATLDSKLLALSEIRGEVLAQTDEAVVALPQENPAALVASNLRTFARERAISINKLDVTGLNSSEELKNMKIEVEIENQDFSQLVSFLSEFINTAPIKTVDWLAVERRSVTSNVSEGELALTIYWASLPTTLPDLTTPVAELTAEQQLVLARIQSLSKPIFTTLDPLPPKERLNPFN